MVDYRLLEGQENTQEENSIEETLSSVGLVVSNIKEEWSWVREGLQQIMDVDPDPKQIPEDIYACVQNGTAILLTTKTKDYFLVVTEHRDQTGLHFVLGWVWSNTKGNKITEKALHKLEQYAKQNGYKSVMAETVVPEVVDYCTKNGFFIDTVVVKKFVN